MKMPNGHLAYVDREKVLAYLLNPMHPDGYSKAQYFQSAGFTTNDWSTLAEALVEVGRTGTVVDASSSGFGERFTVDGNLRCPDKELRGVRTIWIVDRGRVAPRLITAYPLKAME